MCFFFFFSSRRRHTRFKCDWSSDVCSSDLRPGNTLLIVSPGLYVAIVAVFVAGLGCASVYPIYIAWLAQWYGARAKKIGGVLFAIASLGGSVGPWLVGSVSQFSRSLRIGLLVPMLSASIMIGLVLSLRRPTTSS